MSKYDYREAVCDDIRAELEYRGIRVTEENRGDVYSELYDDLFVSDNVTGNASGSYTCNAWVAEEYLCHNMDLLQEACDEFCCEPNMDSAEWCDLTIRCYLLGECLSNVLDELVEEFEEELEKAEAWWADLDFKTMEKVTSFVQTDYSPEDGYQEFVDATDEWWDDLDDVDKVSKYHEHC